jgi:hypothetical protein
MAFRAGTLDGGAGIARKIAGIDRHFFVSADYARAHGVPGSPTS